MLAVSPIRGDLQAHLAVAHEAEQPPASPPASLMLGTTEVRNSRATLPDSSEAAAPAPRATLSVAIPGRAGASVAPKISPAADELEQRVWWER